MRVLVLVGSLTPITNPPEEGSRPMVRNQVTEPHP
jgi:hypothetical protein